ncbi:MAG: hypothetical protein K2N80_05240 [Lachnospiraceae bacterium]|nr:hypothetical protein [Lachnospiraceae bacterium]
MSGLEELKEKYWRTVSMTRKSGRIAGSVKERIEREWRRFDEEVILEALRIHISRYKDYKENYTIGIMRNIQKQKDATGRVGNSNKFGSMMKQDYDMESLERELLAN